MPCKTIIPPHPTAAQCRFCRPGRCTFCGAGGQVHWDHFWVGGRGWQGAYFCHDIAACRRRRVVRHGLCAHCEGRITRPEVAVALPDGGRLCGACAGDGSAAWEVRA